MLRMMTWVAMGMVGIALAGIAYIAIATATTKLPGSEMTPAGFRARSSVYIRMRDGARIAVTAFLPRYLQAGERVPVLMRTTRYWRSEEVGWGLRVMVALHLVSPSTLVDQEVAYFNERRFAVIVVDARGS